MKDFQVSVAEKRLKRSDQLTAALRKFTQRRNRLCADGIKRGNKDRVISVDKTVLEKVFLINDVRVNIHFVKRVKKPAEHFVILEGAADRKF